MRKFYILIPGKSLHLRQHLFYKRQRARIRGGEYLLPGKITRFPRELDFLKTVSLRKLHEIHKRAVIAPHHDNKKSLPEPALRGLPRGPLTIPRR